MVIHYLKRAYSSFAAHVFDIPPRLLALLLFMLLIFLPITKPDDYIQRMFRDIFFFATLAASWDLLVGRTGQISLGHALFFGIGAYGTALLYKYFGFPPWVTIPIAVLIGVSISPLIGSPCLRAKGPYLALVTMVLPLILNTLFKYSPLLPITGGERGIGPLPPLIPVEFFRTIGFSGRKAYPMVDLANYYLGLVLLCASSIILYKIANSKTGMVFVSILDDDLASKACGINVTRYKLIAFAISSLFAALTGATYAHVITIVNPSGFLDITLSFLPVILTFLGGIGTLYGPLVGAHIYFIIHRYVLQTTHIPYLTGTQWTFTRDLIFAAVVIILIIKWPRGIARFVTDKLQDLEEARDLDERGKWIWKKYKKEKTK